MPLYGQLCCSWTVRPGFPISIRKGSAKKWRCLPWIPGEKKLAEVQLGAGLNRGPLVVA